ncbi:hypothetical protein BDM02DRAFT_3100708, partial [Thelephora ganbajun]
VALRQQMSNLRHSIRQQTAQLHGLESIVLRGPRPLPPGMINSPPSSPTDSSFHLSSSHRSSDMSLPPPPSNVANTISNINKRNSREHLYGLAGPESSLPLPRRDLSRTRNASGGGLDDGMDGIKEGIPSSFGSTSSAHLHTPKRQSSPTRSLSRIPVSSVGNARVMADESFSSPAFYLNDTPTKLDVASPSPGSVSPRRQSFTPGGTTKVLADLQAGILSTRNKLDDTKHQLRQSQRQVSQLTRQTEDLKEARERLRLENEGLNNVVARKERLLQELLERARKAESEVITLRAQLKSDSTMTKKNLREMEATVAEQRSRTQKSEREYTTLKESIDGMKRNWKTDIDALREEMNRRDDKARAEAAGMAKKYRKMADELKASQTDGESIKKMKAEDGKIRKEIEDGFRDQIRMLKEEMAEQTKENSEAVNTARELALELGRLRRLMRVAGTSPDQHPPDTDA